MSHARFTWQSALTRALIGSLGGLALAWSFMVGASALLIAMRWMSRSDAVVTAGMLSFLLWMAAVLVAFGAATLRRATAWVGGSIAAFALLGWICLRSTGAA
jgi:hypothetical protein